MTRKMRVAAVAVQRQAAAARAKAIGAMADKGGQLVIEVAVHDAVSLGHRVLKDGQEHLQVSVFR